MSRLQKMTRLWNRVRTNAAENFGLWNVGRTEWFFIRLLFVYAVFQTMPLGPPFSSLWEKIVPVEQRVAIVENDLALRPPFPPLTKLMPNSEPSMNFTEQPQPNGLGQYFDFTFFADPGFQKTLPWLVLPALLLYLIGHRYTMMVALPVLTFVSIGSRTLHNSQGAIHHGFQIVSLVLLAQTVVILWPIMAPLFARLRRAIVGRISKDRLEDELTPHSARQEAKRRMRDKLVYAALAAVVVCYVVAGGIKLFKSDGEWIANSHFIGIQLVKTDRQNYYNELDGEKYGRNPVPYANDMLKHKNLSRPFMACGLMLELFAFLALYNRLTALFFGISVVLFHYFNDLIMGLTFFNNEKIVWIFFINLPFWIGWLLTKRKNKMQPIGEAETAAVGA